MSYSYYRRFRRNSFAAKKTEMISKFSSDCRGCNKRIVAGDKIVRNKENVWVCEDCVETTVKFTHRSDASETSGFAPRYAVGARVAPRGRCEDAPCCGCGCTDIQLTPPEFAGDYW